MCSITFTDLREGEAPVFATGDPIHFQVETLSCPVRIGEQCVSWGHANHFRHDKIEDFNVNCTSFGEGRIREYTIPGDLYPGGRYEKGYIIHVRGGYCGIDHTGMCEARFNVSDDALHYWMRDVCRGNSDCEECVLRGNSWTAFGCVESGRPTNFIIWLLRWGVGVGGGIALLLIIAGGFRIITSGGDPERVKAGREMVVSAVAGLLLIIFSVFILQIIGGRIFELPGL